MFRMKKTKQEEKPVELTPEQRRYKITELLQQLGSFERGLATFDSEEKNSQVKVEFTIGSYNYHYFGMEMAASALKGLFFVKIAEIKEQLLALGVQP